MNVVDAATPPHAQKEMSHYRASRKQFILLMVRYDQRF